MSFLELIAKKKKMWSNIFFLRNSPICNGLICLFLLFSEILLLKKKMTGHHSLGMESNLHNVKLLTQHASDSALQSDTSANKSKPVIVHMNGEPATTNSSKLKSLVPKTCVKIIPKSHSSVFSLQVSDGLHMQPVSKLAALMHTDLVVSQLSDDTSAQEISATAPVASLKFIENILQQFQGSLSSTDASEANMTHSCVERDQTSQSKSDDIDKEQDIIKKTVVEAFVKMVVCRKVTVQKVHAKTGEILDTKVKTVCLFSLLSFLWHLFIAICVIPYSLCLCFSVFHFNHVIIISF